MTFQGTQYHEMPKESRKTKDCRVCGKPFVPHSGVHKHCSETCKGKWKYLNGDITTKKQYEAISGNWSRYFDRLLGKGRRGVLSRNDLLTLLDKQQGLCALSGIPLTCTLLQGTKYPNNASIDRIEAGGTYAPENIQLVCSALNGFRKDCSVDDFINYCITVADYQKKEGKFVCRT
jgi:hypothetical protein